MRNNKFIFLITLLLLSLIISCSDSSGVRLRFEAEKMFHDSEKKFSDAQLKNELGDPKVLANIQNDYMLTVEFCYESLDSIPENSREHLELQLLTFRSVSRLSQFYYARKRFDSSVFVTEKLINTIPLMGTPLLESNLNLGQALHARGDWDSTLVIYDMVLNKFYPPIDPEGNISYKLFNLPYHIFKISKATKQNEAQIHFEFAEQYYQKLLSEFPNSLLESPIHTNLALLYDEMGFWEKEISELSKIKDSSSESMQNLAIKIGDIYLEYLKDNKAALDQFNLIKSQINTRDTLKNPMIDIRVAKTYMNMENFAEARQILMNIKRNYRSFHESSPTNQHLIAKSFDKENNWKRAEIEYNLLLEKFKTSDEAMTTYLYLFDHFQKFGPKSEVTRIASRALKSFDQIISNYSGTIFEAKAKIYKADLFIKQKQWLKAAEIMVSIFDRFPQSEYGRKAINTAAIIYKDKLNSPEKAKELRDRYQKSLANLK